MCRDGLRVLGSLEECAEAGFHLGLLAAGEAGPRQLTKTKMPPSLPVAREDSLPGKLPAKIDGSIIHEIKEVV